MQAGNELDTLVAEKVMGLTVVGLADAWDPEGSGWCIFRPEERLHGELRPVHASCCNCDLILQREPYRETPLIDKESWDRYEDDKQREFEAEKALWGHSSHCLEVVPFYSTDIRDAWLVVEQLRREYGCVEVTANFDGYWAGVGNMLAAKPLAQADADSAPLAICLAALSVRGI